MNDALSTQPRDGARRWTLWFFFLVIFAAGLGFSYKLYEFIHDLLAEEGLRFAGAHILTYLLVAGGFFLLLLFAFLTGHFSDIEQPKYDLLEREKELDRRELEGRR
jgi:hypothetical protein